MRVEGVDRKTGANFEEHTQPQETAAVTRAQIHNGAEGTRRNAQIIAATGL